jgi:hypothetical protein
MNQQLHRRKEVSGMVGFTTGGLVVLLVITFGILAVGYLAALIAWYAKNREKAEEKGVRGAYGGEWGESTEAATGRHPGSMIPGSGHA